MAKILLMLHVVPAGHQHVIHVEKDLWDPFKHLVHEPLESYSLVKPGGMQGHAEELKDAQGGDYVGLVD